MKTEIHVMGIYTFSLKMKRTKPYSFAIGFLIHYGKYKKVF